MIKICLVKNFKKIKSIRDVKQRRDQCGIRTNPINNGKRQRQHENAERNYHRRNIKGICFPARFIENLAANRVAKTKMQKERREKRKCRIV